MNYMLHFTKNKTKITYLSVTDIEGTGITSNETLWRAVYFIHSPLCHSMAKIEKKKTFWKLRRDGQ